MIFYFVLLYFHTCHCGIVTRGERIETAKGEAVCRQTCTCRSPTATFFNVRGEEKCMAANGTGCLLKVDGYTADVPLITQSMLKKTVFRITKDGGNVCSNTLGTFEASGVRMLALTDQWEAIPTFMSNSVLYSIPNVQEVKVTYNAVWSGLLIKLEVRCKASNGNEYTPRENCVLFKYEGTAAYPLTLSSFVPKSSTTKRPLTQPPPPPSSSTTAVTTKVKQKATGSLSSVLTTSTSGTDTNSNELTSSTPSCEYNKTVVIVGAILGAVNMILIVIVIIFICEVKKWDKRRIKQSTGDLNLAESSFGYEVTIHDTDSGEEQVEDNQSCQNTSDNANYTPLIFDSKENGKSNYTTLSKDVNEISINRAVGTL